MQLKHLSLVSLVGAAAAQSLTEAIGSNPDLSALGGLVGSLPQEVQQVLGSANNITVLAPNNDAITKLLASPAGMSLGNNTDAIAAVLQYHIINGTFPAAQIPEALTFVPTLLTNERYSLVTGGQRVGVQREGEGVTVFSGAGANSTVVTADVNFTGGVIHVIDTVLTLPVNVSTTATAAGLTALAGALTTLNLVEAVDTLPDVTIFAPNNAAFEAIAGAIGNLTTDQLTSILTYHVINGTVGYSSELTDGQQIPTLGGGQITINIEDGNVLVNNARVVTPNVLVRNGVVHVIDNVLSPNATSTDQGPIVPSVTGSNIPFTTQGGGATPTPSSGGESPSSTGAVPDAATMPTGAIGMAALFGAAAIGAVNF